MEVKDLTPLLAAYTGPLPQRANVRGRGGAKDVTPRTKAKIAVEYAEEGGKAGGAGRKVARRNSVEQGYIRPVHLDLNGSPLYLLPSEHNTRNSKILLPTFVAHLHVDNLIIERRLNH